MDLRKRISFLLLALSIQFLGFGQTYSDWFTKDVLRVDLTHAGTFDEEYYFVEAFSKETEWAGAKTKLIDQTGYGDNFMEVYDSLSQKLIYSRAYNNLFYEWQETEEAKRTNRSFEEVLRFPFPLKTVEVRLYKRQKNRSLKLLHHFFVNPRNYRIVKEQKYNFKTKKIIGTLPPNKAIDIVLMAEGYTKEELELFEKDARTLSEFLLNTEPFNQVRDRFNIRLIFSESQESGTDIPGQDIWKNTVFNSHFYTFGSERYLTSQAIKKIHDVASLVPYDQVYVLVNSEKYGGGGIFNYYNLTSAHNALSPWVFIHEFGHGFAGLADEYFDGSTAFNNIYDLNTEPWRPNISTLSKPETKWKDKVKKGTPIPTPASEEYKDKIGFYEGGGYVEKGIFRAYQTCEMKALKEGFCPICQDAILKMVDFCTDN